VDFRQVSNVSQIGGTRRTFPKYSPTFGEHHQTIGKGGSTQDSEWQMNNET
jgi:hypothetical protein